MATRGRQRLPSIDYVLSSVAVSCNMPASTERSRGSTLYEPLQAALLQWANRITAPHTPCCVTHTHSEVSLDSASSARPATGRKYTRKVNQGIREGTGATTFTPAAVAATMPIEDASFQRHLQTEAGDAGHPPSITVPSLKEQVKKGDADMAATANNHSVQRNWQDVTTRTVLHKQPHRENPVLHKHIKASRETRRYHGRASELAVGQLATCRERLSEIDFRVIERPDGLMACSLCHEPYRTKTLATRHAISHLEDPKPFACSVCNKRFSRCDTLHRHTKRKACKIELRRHNAEWDEPCHVLKTTL